MKTRTLVAGFVISALLSACASQPSYVDTDNDRGPITMSLDYRDFNKAADAAIEELLASPNLVNPAGGRYILAIGRISNRTMQHIDTDSVVKKIRVALLNSGRVVTTTAIAHGGPEDDMVMQVRSLRTSTEFDQSSVAEQGTLRAPDLSLTGKFIQRTVRAGKNHQQVEYRFQISVTDLRSGVAIFEHEKEIVKRGTNKTVVW
ncbi:penicillin-binding protein activator LpoB [Granulosicoccus antarcticus]|uniref:Penicillin-binding protein activator LpoB n=1 Tax=Granulosicoccus antarcticus IMCC3135 TaxID=1192854 RepID=A0A2Z2NYY5_9GAMM|nr:penicillin-binding protein activator LpoB [Granulosicoccus antarcticus]ASJ76662.1 hypothetical protein IMCC3135_33090 [Granulosicoccus antarcticus IMCC3135]